jgi:hypothetical protein
MGLIELYNGWTFSTPNTLGNKTPREQSSGSVAVDFLSNKYQTEVRNRTPGDKVVTHTNVAPDEDSTGQGNSTFNAYNLTQTDTKKSGLKYYSTLTGNTALIRWNGDLIQKYKAQTSNLNDKYSTSQSISDSPGVLYKQLP